MELRIDLFASACSKHKKPCMMKTGVSEGPLKGKSFLICAHPEDPCDQAVPIEQEPIQCRKHGKVIELTCPMVKNGERRLLFRCSHGRTEGKWCSYKQLMVDSSRHGNASQSQLSSRVNAAPGRALKDVNVFSHKDGTNPLQKLKSNATMNSEKPKETSEKTESVIQSAADPSAAKMYIISEIEKKKNLLRMADRLPDKGRRIKEQLHALQLTLAQHESAGGNEPPVERSQGALVVARSNEKPGDKARDGGSVVMPEAQRLPPHVVREMYASSASSQRLYGGRMTERRLETVNTVTSEAIESLHRQLESCPPEEKESADPKRLRVPLMMHQRQALAWLKWREQQTPPGGVLADDMGLGKTLTMISLVLSDVQRRKDRSDTQSPQWLNKSESVLVSNGTLVVCPASLVHQWAKELEARCEAGSVSYVLYHGANREQSILKLAGADIVLTTYNLVQREIKLPDSLRKDKAEQDKAVGEDQVMEGDGSLARIAWRRVILDEAHNIKNARSATALSICRLRARHRWALTGTPIQNDLLDFYSLLRFLRCSPFDELKVWKRWVDNKNVSGEQRLSVLIKSLLLRRTKDQKTSTGAALVPLPDKMSKVHYLELGTEERRLYDYLFDKCRSTVERYLSDQSDDSVTAANLNRSGKVKGDTILLMLLRLRQCCSHPALTKEVLKDEELKGEGVELDLVSALKELNIQEQTTLRKMSEQTPLPGTSPSSKISALIKKIEESEAAAKHSLKFVVVSQWTSMLDLVAKSLVSKGLSYYTIKGDVSPKKRCEMVEDFNSNPSSPPVMLVSLRAGGVGLNLTGASNLFIMDLHWNPALERQACDRIYRVGQTRDVTIHKFICKNTIEEQILTLQDNKLKLADDALTGAQRSNNKLTLNDLKVLFGIGTAYQ